MSTRYAHTPAEWGEIAAKITGKTVGWDTEYYREDGTDARKGSARLCKVWVWSLAFPNGRQSPRGFPLCSSVVLPAQALHHPPMQQALLSATLVGHNVGVDVHATENTVPGLVLNNTINTLDIARLVWPELKGSYGFGLKALMEHKLGLPPVGEFSDLFIKEVTETTIKVKEVTTKICSCGVPKCRKRKGHTKTEVTELVEVPVTKTTTVPCPLPEIVPGHPLWEVLVPYAGLDAEAALSLLHLLTREHARQKRPNPWV